MRNKAIILGAIGIALLVPGSAAAAGGSSPVNATVGTELSLAAATPTLMTLTHASAGTSSSVVTVTSTQASWTLSIADNNTGTNAGKMLKSVGSTPLTDPLQWSPDNSTFNNLTASAVSVGTGALVGAKTVYFKQPLEAADATAAADNYALTVAYTVA
ncbi:MAG TPA: hypothetical protein VGN69_03395 [Solirubrobacteraceae bacterium]|jgi:hypothetical protein|nr:hypothetical protein [Solirubrobacteraceae bacterium]